MPTQFLKSVSLLAVLFLTAAIAASAAASEDPQNQPNEHAAGYAGAEACQPCHDDLYSAVNETKHEQLFRNKNPEDSGCESCHGAGQAHIDGGGDSAKIRSYPRMSNEQVRVQCRRCHQVSGDKPHVKKGVRCLSCHSIHHFQDKKALLVLPANRLCQKCHTH